MHNDNYRPDEVDLTEDWSFLFPDDEDAPQTPPTPPSGDGINWDDYNFNFDSEFGPYRQAAPTPRQAVPRTGESFSVDAMRRLHEGQAQYGTPTASSLPQQPYARPVRTAPEPARGRRTPESDVPQALPRRKKKHRLLKGLLVTVALLLALLILASVLLLALAKMPQTNQPVGLRKDGCAAILLAGTDAEGTRTDTLMLLYIDLPNKTMRLLSIPRDTMVNRDNPVPKINGAYGANGSGEKGMSALMDYVQDLIGYRPDGYVLIDFDCFESLVNLMGGVNFDVPMDMHYEDPYQDLYIDLKEGAQHLSGEQAMWLVRFRSGYAMADLERVNVQRAFLSEAMSQWSSAWNAPKLPFALNLLMQNTTTDLSTTELVWVAKAVVRCRSGYESDTLPGYGDYINGGSYYIESVDAAAALVNEKYNPYETEITAYDLHPYGR